MNLVSAVHISVPRYESVELKRYPCPTCNKVRFFVRCVEEWYGFTLICLRCGERFSDCSRHQRPFERGWRKKSIESAKRVFTNFHKEKANGRVDQ